MMQNETDARTRAKHYVGIDFGTSNSYCCLTTEGFISAAPVVFDGRSSISTSVLWHVLPDGNETLVAFGDQAVEEWGLRSPAERRNYRISTMFKPDIGQSETARKDARAFLSALLQGVRQEKLLPPASSSQVSVIMGTPAVKPDGFEARLNEITASLDIADIRTVPEPVGALITHVAMRHDLSPGDARSGVLVIDFGGGTCDVAYMLRLDVKTAWGDPFLGGRLFDDLFYQWFLETNPHAEQRIRKSQDEYYIHWIVCREMKERFSITMNRNRNAEFSHHVHVADTYYGGLNNVTWEEFISRARSYTPGRQMAEILADTETKPWRKKTGSCDLIEWFETVISHGMQTHRLQSREIRFVILTGGSSGWPFVKDIVTDSFRIQSDRLFFSANPMTAVGEGIALLPVIQGLHAQARVRIRHERDEKIRQIIERIDRLADTFAEDIAGEIVERIVNDDMRRVLSDFSRNGGSLEDLKQRISETVNRHNEACTRIIRRHEADILAAVNLEVVDVLDQWFKENGMRNWSSDRHYLEELGVRGPDGSGLRIDDPLFDLIQNIGHLIMMSGVGSVMGGAGVALLLPGLPGLVVGAVIGVVFSMIGFRVFKDPIQKTVDRILLPSWAASMLFSDSRLDKMVRKLRNQLHRDITIHAQDVFDEKLNEVQPAIETLVDAVIEDLTALDHL